MKRILILIIGLIGVAYGQSSPTSAKTRFVNGIYLGTKLDAYFAAADSNAIYWRADSSLMAKYKGTARALAFAVSGGYLPISDTAAMLAPYLRRTDSTGLLSKVVRTFGTQIIGGNKTFDNDIFVNSARVGIGAGGNTSNSVLGYNVFTANTSGTNNTAVGENALSSNVSATDNTAFGWYSLDATSGSGNTGIGSNALGTNTSGSNNTAIGFGAGEYITGSNPNTTGTNSIYIGFNTKAAANGGTNQTVIGHNLTGNGSNTVTIGNSSVTDNYFSGVLRATRGIFSSTPTLINTTTHNGIDTLQVNGSIFGTRGRFNNGFSSQIEAWGWNNIQGASTNAGEIRFGGTSSIQGRLIYASAGNTTMYLENTFDDAAAEIILRTRTAGTAVDLLKLQNNGLTSTIVYNTTVGATNRDVFVDNTGLIGYVSSFRASKKNIVPISNTDWLHKLSPVTFNYRVKDKKGNYTDSAYNELEYGLVAEEVEPINKEMVFYDVDSTGKKQLRGVHYSKLIIPLLAEVKEHKKKLDEQQTIIEALLTRIKALEAKLK